jgi:hypothetical protein
MWGLQSHRALVKESHVGGHGSFLVPGSCEKLAGAINCPAERREELRIANELRSWAALTVTKKRFGHGLSRQETDAEEFRWPALKSLLISFSLSYNIIHEKSCPARNDPFRHSSVRRHRIVKRRGLPVGFGAGGAKEDVAAITRDPHYRNFQAGPLAALFFFDGCGIDGRPGRCCLELIFPARLGSGG